MNICIRPAQQKREIREAYTLAAHVFGPTYAVAKRRKAHLLKTEPVQSLQDVIVALDSSRIVGMARIVERKNYFLNRRIKTGGVTHVCVASTHRGHAIGRRLMNAAIAEMARRHYSASLIVARRAVDGFYDKFGYVGTGVFVELRLSRNKHSAYALQHDYCFRRGYAPRSVTQYKNYYTRVYKPLGLTFCRGLAWWRQFPLMMKYRLKKNNFVNVIRGRHLIGYFVHHDNRIIEAACSPTSTRPFCRALLDYLFRRRGADIIVALPLQHPCMSYYRQYSGTLTLRRVLNGGHMLRVLDAPAITAFIRKYVGTLRSQFSPAMLRAAEQYVALLPNLNNPLSDDSAYKYVMRLLQEEANPVLRQLREKLTHSWSLIDEF